VTAPFSFGLSVRPLDIEALLFASLHTESDCSGKVIQSQLMAVRQATANPSTSDAGTSTEGAP
jgi:hypothetical protein